MQGEATGELQAGKESAFLKDYSDVCMKNGLEEEKGIPVRRLCQWSTEMVSQLVGGREGWRGRSGNI